MEAIISKLTVLLHHQSNDDIPSSCHSMTQNSILNSLSLMCVCVCLAAQSCPTFCDPMHYSPPGSPVHWISHARILEWVAISFSLLSHMYILKNHNIYYLDWKGFTKFICCCYERSCSGTKINIKQQKTRVLSRKINMECIDIQIRKSICVELLQLQARNGKDNAWFLPGRIPEKLQRIRKEAMGHYRLLKKKSFGY